MVVLKNDNHKKHVPRDYCPRDVFNYSINEEIKYTLIISVVKEVVSFFSVFYEFRNPDLQPLDSKRVKITNSVNLIKFLF